MALSKVCTFIHFVTISLLPYSYYRCSDRQLIFCDFFVYKSGTNSIVHYTCIISPATHTGDRSSDWLLWSQHESFCIVHHMDLVVTPARVPLLSEYDCHFKYSVVHPKSSCRSVHQCDHRCTTTDTDTTTTVERLHFCIIGIMTCIAELVHVCNVMLLLLLKLFHTNTLINKHIQLAIYRLHTMYTKC